MSGERQDNDTTGMYDGHIILLGRIRSSCFAFYAFLGPQPPPSFPLVKRRKSNLVFMV